MSRARIAITAGMTVMLAAALSGCAPGQSKSDACAIFSDADQALVEAITNSSGSLLDDPATAKTDLSEAVTQFDDAVSDISHDEVKTRVDGMTNALKDFNSQFADAADATVAGEGGVDSAALDDSLTAAENAEGKVVEVCNS